jgi:hypothetical protein
MVNYELIGKHNFNKNNSATRQILQNNTENIKNINQRWIKIISSF